MERSKRCSDEMPILTEMDFATEAPPIEHLRLVLMFCGEAQRGRVCATGVDVDEGYGTRPDRESRKPRETELPPPKARLPGMRPNSGAWPTPCGARWMQPSTSTSSSA